MYALWAESELDAHRIEQLPPNICATQTKSSPGNTLMSGHNQQQRKGAHRGRNRYNVKGTYYRKSGISASKQGGAHHDRGDTRKCWNCHETGPIRQMCTHLSAIQMSPSLNILSVNSGSTEIVKERSLVPKYRLPCYLAAHNEQCRRMGPWLGKWLSCVYKQGNSTSFATR